MRMTARPRHDAGRDADALSDVAYVLAEPGLDQRGQRVDARLLVGAIGRRS